MDNLLLKKLATLTSLVISVFLSLVAGKSLFLIFMAGILSAFLTWNLIGIIEEVKANR